MAAKGKPETKEINRNRDHKREKEKVLLKDREIRKRFNVNVIQS